MDLGLEQLMGVPNNTTDVSFEQLVIEDQANSRELLADLNTLGEMFTGCENLIAIRNYVAKYGVNDAIINLIDADGALSAIVGNDISVERLDDAITNFFAKIGAFFSGIGTKIGHKISTWFPTMNRYEVIFNKNVKLLGSKAPNPAWVDKKVRGIAKSKYQEVIKRRAEGLEALKKAAQGISGDIEKMLHYYSETTIARLGGLFALYKKDSMIQKLFQKERISILGYKPGDSGYIIQCGKSLVSMYGQYRTVLSGIAKQYAEMDEGMRQALNKGQSEEFKSLNRRMARIRAFVWHMWTFIIVSLDQMTDEMAFVAYATTAMVKATNTYED